MSMRKISKKRFDQFRALTITTHVLSLLLGAAIFSTALVEHVTYQEYYTVIRRPSKGTGRSFMYMSLCAVFSALCPIIFFATHFLFPLMVIRANRRRKARSAIVLDCQLINTLEAPAVMTPLSVVVMEGTQLAHKDGLQSEDLLASLEHMTTLDADDAASFLDTPEHTHGDAEAVTVSRPRRCSIGVPPRDSDTDVYHVNWKVLYILQIMYFTVTLILLILTFFIGLFGALGTAFANMNASYTIAQGWIMFFQHGEITPASNDKLCKLQLKGMCSGGENLCNAMSYDNVSYAYELSCPLCPDDQVRIAHFTKTCASHYHVGAAYPITYFVFAVVSAVLLLSNFALSALCFRHSALPCLSYEENILCATAMAQTDTLPASPSMPHPSTRSHRRSHKRSHRQLGGVTEVQTEHTHHTADTVEPEGFQSKTMPSHRPVDNRVGSLLRTSSRKHPPDSAVAAAVDR